jgi:hypothetical protein
VSLLDTRVDKFGLELEVRKRKQGKFGDLIGHGFRCMLRAEPSRQVLSLGCVSTLCFVKRLFRSSRRGCG